MAENGKESMIRDLVQGYIDGSITNEESGILLGMLKERPALVVRMLDEMKLESLVSETIEEDVAAATSKSSPTERKVAALRAALRKQPEVHSGKRIFSAPMLALAAGLLVAAGVWWISGSSAKREVAGTAESGGCRVSGGECRVSGAAGEMRVGKAGESVRVGETVTTADGGYARIEMPDGSTVELNAETVLAVGAAKPGGELTLERGDVYVQARKQMKFNPGRYDQIANLGTVFEISRVKDGATTVRVAQGEVQFGVGNGTLVVKTLQSSQVSPGGAPGAPGAVALAGIGAWSRAVAPGSIYQDGFDKDRLESFWTKIHPQDKVQIKDGMLNLSVAAAADNAQDPVCTEMVSKPVRLGGRAVEIVLKRNKTDGPSMFLPMEGEPTVGVELTDESGRLLCRARWKTYRFTDKSLLTGCYVTIGQEERGNVATGTSPVTLRIVVDPEGRVIVGQGTSEAMGGFALLAEGHTGKLITEVRLRLYLTNRGAKEVAVRWAQMAATRLDKWPEWSQKSKP
ncbi:MAG: hypothetical protein C0404_06775 [Verrucomicrobia bacterium]|nr:hypothetical protein [Verrucomicrobiota bacterium]